MQTKFSLIFITIFTFFCWSLSAQVTHTYVGPAVAANNWNTAANWDTNSIPAVGDNVIINTQVVFTPQTTPPAPANFRIEDNVVLNFDLIAGSTSGTAEAVRITGSGALTVAAGATLTVQANTASSEFGIFMFSGANLTVQSGGTVDVTEAHRGISFSGNATTATLVNDGTITITGTTTNDGIQASTGATPNITNNGTITISGQDDDCIELTGGTINNTGTLNLEAGTQNGDHGLLISAGATVTNTGTITLSGTNIPQRMFIDGDFTNDKGGILDIGNGRIRNNNGTVINEGLIKSTFAGSGIFRSGTGTNTNNAFFDYADASYGFASNGVTDRGIALADPTETTVSTGDDSDNDACTVDLAHVSCDWYNGGSLVATSAANGNLSFPENSVPTTPAVLTLQEYGGAVSITVTDICDFSTLPVELIDFSAKATDKGVALFWQTAIEINNDYFTLERSNNGRDFEKIEQISGAGNSDNRVEYETIDFAPLKGENYYRLRQIDFDGKETLHTVISVFVKNEESVKVYPTLVNNEINIAFQEILPEGTIQIFDMTGKAMGEYSTSGYKNTIDLSFLNKGTYTLRLLTGSEIFTYKFLKN